MIKRKRKPATEQHQQSKKSKAGESKLAEPVSRGAGNSGSGLQGGVKGGGSGGLGLVADYGSSSEDE